MKNWYIKISFVKKSKIICVILTSFILVNLSLFLYERQTGWIDLNGAATNSIWNPGSTIIHGREGYGIHKVDKYGYLNSCDFDSSSYVLALGSSHTQGKEVLNGLRYSDLLNSFIGDNSSKCFVYNVSQDAYLFDKIAKNFKAVIGHYPKSQSIIIETYPSDELHLVKCNFIIYPSNQNFGNYSIPNFIA